MHAYGIRQCKHYQATATSARNIYVVLRVSPVLPLPRCFLDGGIFQDRARISRQKLRILIYCSTQICLRRVRYVWKWWLWNQVCIKNLMHLQLVPPLIARLTLGLIVTVSSIKRWFAYRKEILGTHLRDTYTIHRSDYFRRYNTAVENFERRTIVSRYNWSQAVSSISV